MGVVVKEVLDFASSEIRVPSCSFHLEIAHEIYRWFTVKVPPLQPAGENQEITFLKLLKT